MKLEMVAYLTKDALVGLQKLAANASNTSN